MILNITYQCQPGETFNQAVLECIQLSRNNNCNVTLEIQDKEFIVSYKELLQIIKEKCEKK